MALLTQRSQGLRWRKPDWDQGKWIIVNRVSVGPIRTVYARDQNGNLTIFLTHALDKDWIIHTDAPQL